jgi:hypothetical protein
MLSGRVWGNVARLWGDLFVAMTGAKREGFGKRLTYAEVTGKVGASGKAAVAKNCESIDRVDRIVEQIHQPWNNRLDFPLTKIPERYAGLQGGRSH